MFVRTSPQQSGRQREGDYQLLGMQKALLAFGVNCSAVFRAPGLDGRSVCKKLREAIEFAEFRSLPVLAHDWERLCHDPHKLEAYPVDFVSVLPLVSSDELPSLRKLAFNQLFPDRKGGRPPEEYPVQRIIQLRQLSGMSYRDIAKMTGVSKTSVERICSGETVPKHPREVYGSIVAE
ncbi:hypothetical protein Psta_0444 [Pirellula staleyi DSM 6068]|uniref:RNA polymerase sigma factor 70 region 4 type 2 domain-containing protein n=1 Tax=Pirellula staleyi (strain ATCC 27377 / DSM 6068 / ICPB 4128) TaxID=530564 RepID=D2R3A1_PIRSD|nr:hypothetical protein Psta_0444 [Pirellula staleyi DSM 6068]